MAKELFDSPRYGKKGFISQYDIFLYFWLISGITFISIGAYITNKFHLDDATFLYFSIFGVVIVPIVFAFGKFKYRQYKKILEDQKDLFHSNGKTPYVAPHEFGMSVSDTNYSLYLQLLF